MQENKVEKKLFVKAKGFILLLFIVIFIVNGFILFSHYYQLYHARSVLSSAKSVRLSILATAYDYYGIDQAIENPCNKDGLTKGAEKKILTLANCDGDILFVDFDTKEMKLKELVYMEDKYYAVYSSADDEVSWDVYRSDRMIHY